MRFEFLGEDQKPIVLILTILSLLLTNPANSLASLCDQYRDVKEEINQTPEKVALLSEIQILLSVDPEGPYDNSLTDEDFDYEYQKLSAFRPALVKFIEDNGLHSYREKVQLNEKLTIAFEAAKKIPEDTFKLYKLLKRDLLLYTYLKTISPGTPEEIAADLLNREMVKEQMFMSSFRKTKVVKSAIKYGTDYLVKNYLINPGIIASYGLYFVSESTSVYTVFSGLSKIAVPVYLVLGLVWPSDLSSLSVPQNKFAAYPPTLLMRSMSDAQACEYIETYQDIHDGLEKILQLYDRYKELN
ncbi:MAG: hypothetical protein HOE90_09115 [Bacteriovoracaceae bacterium]|nr:hypothetical protein [Bacteriovoracaceae bacterium]